MNTDTMKHRILNHDLIKGALATTIAATGVVNTAINLLITTVTDATDADVTALDARVTAIEPGLADFATTPLVATVADLTGGLLTASVDGIQTITLPELTAAHVGIKFTLIKKVGAGAITLKYDGGGTIAAATAVDAVDDNITFIVTGAETVEAISSIIAS